MDIGVSSMKYPVDNLLFFYLVQTKYVVHKYTSTYLVKLHKRVRLLVEDHVICKCVNTGLSLRQSHLGGSHVVTSR